ncbi:hypothetical protein ACWKT3_02665 [Streptomyces violaceus]
MNSAVTQVAASFSAASAAVVVTTLSQGLPGWRAACCTHSRTFPGRKAIDDEARYVTSAHERTDA